MKLVHITTVPQSLRFVRGQIGYVRTFGLDVEAISSPGEELRAFGESEEIRVHGVEMPRRITPLHDLKAVWQLSRVLHRIKPTIVHAHTPKGGLLGMISSWLTRTPIRVYHIRGFPYMTATGKRRALLKTTERVACLLANRVFCVSHSIREVAIADGIVPAEKIVVFAGGSGNGVDANGRFNPDRFSYDEIAAIRAESGIAADEVVIGFVGRIVRDKGIEELAHSWWHIREENPKARLVIVGLIEPQDPISEQTLSSLRQDSRVIMTGPLQDTSFIYPILDLLVLPSYREGFPNVALEAASMGIPVVATNIPGCTDAVEDGVTGTLVPVQDADALAETMQMYLNDSDLRENHGQAGRKRVIRDFQQEIIWGAIIQEYRRLLKEKELPILSAPEPPPAR